MYEMLKKRGYEELYLEEQKQKLRIILDFFRNEDFESVLDVGAGTAWAKQYFPNKKYVALEPEKELVKEAKCEVIIAGAENMPIKDNSFDLVLSLTALHHVKDVEKAIKECKRVGRKLFAFSILKRSKKFKDLEKAILKEFKDVKIVEEKQDRIYLIKS